MPLVRILADIALWCRGPRDLPASGPLLGVVMSLYVAQSALQAGIATDGRVTIAYGLADLVVTCLLLGALLVVRHRLYRLPQTLLAVLGTGILLSPLLVVLATGQAAAADNGLLANALGVALIALLVWNVLILAHILRAALDTSLPVAVLLAVACGILSYELTTFWLVPVQGAAGA